MNNISSIKIKTNKLLQCQLIIKTYNNKYNTERHKG